MARVQTRAPWLQQRLRPAAEACRSAAKPCSPCSWAGWANTQRRSFRQAVVRRAAPSSPLSLWRRATQAGRGAVHSRRAAVDTGDTNIAADPAGSRNLAKREALEATERLERRPSSRGRSKHYSDRTERERSKFPM